MFNRIIKKLTSILLSISVLCTIGPPILALPASADILADQQHTHTIEIVQTKGGTINCDHVTAKLGERVILTATPDPGYGFVSYYVNKSWGWLPNMDTVFYEPVWEFEMPDTDIKIKPSFSNELHSIDITQSDSGVITCSRMEAYTGQRVTISAIPIGEYSLSNVEIKLPNGEIYKDCKDSAGQIQHIFNIYMPASDVSINASFVLGGNKIIIEQRTGGIADTPIHYALSNSLIPITIKPDVSYRLTDMTLYDKGDQYVRWIQDTRGFYETDRDYIVYVTVPDGWNKDYKTFPVFTNDVHNVKFIQPEGGSVYIQPKMDARTCNDTTDYFNDSTWLSECALPGYQFVHFLINGVRVRAQCTSHQAPIFMRNQDIIVSALFDKVKYNVKIADGTSIYVRGDVTTSVQSAYSGDEVVVNVTPYDGYIVREVTVNNKTLPYPYKFIMPAENVRIDVYFEEQKAHRINCMSGSGGHITSNQITGDVNGV